MSLSAMRFVKRCLIIGLSLGVVVLPGCWNRQEIDTLGFVMAVGVDQAEQEGMIQLTVQIVKPSASAMQNQLGASAERGFWLASSTGHTVFEAVRNFLTQSPRRLYWPHNRRVVFGEEAARKGVLEYIDFFARNGETRRTAHVMVVKGARAADFLQAEFEMEALPAEGLGELMKAATARLSTVVEVTVHEFLIALESEGVEPTMSRVEIIEKRAGDIVGDTERTEVSRSPRLTGAAAFKGDRFVGWLDRTDTRGLLWIKGETKSGIIVIMHPEDEREFIGLELLRAGSRISANFRDGRISMHVRVDAEADIGDTHILIDPVMDPELVLSMERRMATVIRNEIASVLERAQKEYHSDIFGFGRVIHRSFPREWKKLKDRWDEEFPFVDVEIEVRARIRRSGVTGRSTTIR